MHRVSADMWIFRDFQADRRRAGSAFFLSALLLFTECLGAALLRAVGEQAAVCLDAGRLFLCLLASVLITVVAGEPFLFRLMGWGFRAEERGAGRHPNRTFFAAWAVIFLAYLPCFFAFYPGLYTYDIGWQWSMYAGEGYSTHHSLLHTWFSGACFELGRQLFGSYNEGLAFYAILQLGILSGSIAFAIRYLVKIRVPRRIWLAVMLFYLLFPFFPIMGISTTKDVIYGALCLITAVGWMEMTAMRKVWHGWRLVLFMAAVILMGQFRNNAIYSMLFLLLCLFFACLWGVLRKRNHRVLWELTALCFVCTVGIWGMNRMLIRVFDAYKGSVAEMLSVPCQQLARTFVYHGEELTEEEKRRLFYYIPEESLAGYQYYVSDPVKSGLNVNGLMDDPKDFIHLWMQLGREYPEEYILSPLYNTMGIWYLTGDSSCYVDFGPAWMFDEEHVIKADSKLPALQKGYRWFQNENIRKYLPGIGVVFYTSFYAWLLYLGIGTLIAKRRLLELVAPLSLLAYILTLSLGPCIQIRYLFGTLLCVPVLLAVIFRRTEHAGNDPGVIPRPSLRAPRPD